MTPHAEIVVYDRAGERIAFASVGEDEITQAGGDLIALRELLQVLRCDPLTTSHDPL